jgi:hypothetical protein
MIEVISIRRVNCRILLYAIHFHLLSKYDFHLLHTRTAGRDRWFFGVMLAAMCQHIDAWLSYASHRFD